MHSDRDRDKEKENRKNSPPEEEHRPGEGQEKGLPAERKEAPGEEASEKDSGSKDMQPAEDPPEGEGTEIEGLAAGKEEPGREGTASEAGGKPDWTRELAGVYEPRRSRVRKKMSPLKKGLLAAVGIVVLSLIGAGAYVMAFYEDVREPERVLLGDVGFEQEYDPDVEAAFSEHAVNIALLGFDRGWSREKMGEELFRPDWLAVFSVDLKTEEVSMVRVPRDAYVPIHGLGGKHDKINHSYFYGYHYGGGEDSHEDGLSYTLQTLSEVLGGVPVHYYISVDMYSVIELVDAVGGIYYEVEETIYDEHWEPGRVLVPEGPQIMDGKTYLRYLQYRGETGDKGRIERQLDLLEQTFVYLREEGKISDLPATYRIYRDYVETDLNYTQIAALAYFAKDLEVEKDIHFHTLTGRSQTRDGIWYEVLNQSERVDVIEEVFGIEDDPWPPIVLEDSEEYLEEQERLRREEERERDDDWPFSDRNDSEEEEPALTVPQVRGKTAREAAEILEDRGLQIGSINERYDDEVAEGLVIYSQPLAGEEASPGAIVNLIVSRGAEPEEQIGEPEVDENEGLENYEEETEGTGEDGL